MANASRKTVQVDLSSVGGKIPETSSSTTNLSVTVASNPNRCLVLCSGNMTISTATFNGGSFVLGKRSTENDGSSGEVWYLANPSVGTYNIAITFTGATSNDRNYVGAVCLYNVDQVDPVNITDDTIAGGTSITSSFTPTENNCVAVDSMYTNSTTAGTEGETLIYKRSAGRSGGCQYETGINVGTETMAWTGLSSGSSASSAAVVVFQGIIPTGGSLIVDLI